MDIFISQVLALLAFFSFPIVQYILLKSSTCHEGNPELWYLPKYGFRLVIRHLPSKKKLFNIKYHSFLRNIIPPSKDCSVSTYTDIDLIKREDFFLFPGTDQILVSFQLKRDTRNTPIIVHTDKLGNELSRTLFQDFKTLNADYMATIDNLFHFDFKISKRAVISRNDLEKILLCIEKDNQEQFFQVTETLDIG